MNKNNEYNILAEDILLNENFLRLKKDNHHGTNKYDHCKRVSKLSYNLAKLLHANEKEAVRVGLLHDFFFGERTAKEENSYLKHPITSAKNAKEIFNVTNKEAKDIETHMFHHVLVQKVLPFVNRREKATLKASKPTSKEGAIVCFADFLVSVYEFERYKLSYSISLFGLFIVNMLIIQ